LTAIEALPSRLDGFHDWVIWLSAVLAAMAVIVGLLWHKRSPIRRTVLFVWRRLIGEPFGMAVRGYVRDAVQPEIACLNTKIDEVSTTVARLSTLNSEQHAETAAKIDMLQTELARHILANPGLPESITGPVPIIPSRHRQGF